MKYVILIALAAVVLWWLRARLRGPAAPTARRRAEPARPQAMLACAHCGVHVPQADVVADAAGRPYCSEAHRLAGPR
ncbi:MAG: hypothetical protein JNM33_03625 [Rubrivivax sp.]|nr:hypothetical protein [Rubrivivax sp.]